jgi:uncharacterized membrane protein
VLYVLVLLVVLLFLLIGTTPQAMADPNNWINLAFWGIIFIVVTIFFVRSLMKKPQPKPTSVQAPAASYLNDKPPYLIHRLAKVFGPIPNRDGIEWRS